MILKILSYLARNGIQAYAVGGAVRDFLMGVSSKDIDVVSIGESSITKLIELGAEYVDPKTAIPVFTLNVHGIRVEVALPRREVKVGSGYRGFSFNTKNVSLEEDLYRRDFTINSMAMSHKGEIIDPFGGVEDVRNRVLKATNPKSFVEDPLRVLRLCRFTAKGFHVDIRTMELANKVSEREFRALPVERFTSEFLKALRAEKFENFLINLVQVPRACSVFFPELLQTLHVPAGPAQYHPEGSLFNHTVEVVKRCTTPEGKFMALVHDLGKLLTPPEQYPRHIGHDSDAAAEFVTSIFKRLKFPNKYLKMIPLAVREHMRACSVSKVGKLITLAETIHKSGAAEPFIELITADGCSLNQVERLKRALDVVRISLRGKIPPAPVDKIKSVVLNLRAQMFNQLQR